MTISTGTILRVVATLLWTDGSVMQNVFNAVITGGGGPWDDNDVVDDALDWLELMYANMVARVSDDCDGSTVFVYEYDGVDDDWDEVGSANWVFNPTGANEQLPRGNAALINARTVDPDVSGKKYVGGLTEEASSDGLIGAATLASLALFAADWGAEFVGATSGATFTPGVWSPKNIELFEMTEEYLLPAIFAYQRRRKRGVGI